MPRQYASFLWRCWHLEGGEQRVEIVHIQAGTRTKARSLGGGLEWMVAQLTQPGGDRQRSSGLRQLNAGGDIRPPPGDPGSDEARRGRPPPAGSDEAPER